MKKTFLILLALIPFCMSGQNFYDTYNLSTSYYQGTAKSMAMGNAMGAVGQDFSAISINPAGLALFRKDTFIFTPSINTTYTTSDFNGTMSSDTKSKLSVNNLGYVGVINNDDPSSSCRSITWGIGMNRTNNFTNDIYVKGVNNSNSLIDAYSNELIANGITNEDQLNNYSSSYIYPLYWCYLIDFDGNELTTPVPLGGLLQKRSANSWGGTNEWTFSMGASCNDKIYFGFSANLPYTYYRRESVYSEENLTNTDFKWWQQEESLSTRGWGVNMKFGIIAFPAKWLRLGLAYHTPSVFRLTDSWKTITDSEIGNDTYTYDIPTQNYSYIMVTPSKLDASAALIFGNFGMITADYELVCYKDLCLTSEDYDYKDLNDGIDDLFKTTSNIRVGTEWRYNKFCFRGGYSFYSSPFGFDMTDFRTNAYSLGFGYTQHFTTIDVAYVLSQRTHNYYLYSPYTTYAVYDDAGEIVPKDVDEITNLHSIVVSLKFRLY